MLTTSAPASRLSTYEAPRVDIAPGAAAAQLAWVWFVVLVVLVVAIGGVALYCISKGRTLKMSFRRGLNFHIACA